MSAYLGVTRHLHFRQNGRGLLRATAVTRGWNGHRIRVRTQSPLRRRTFSRRSCRDWNSQPFDQESGALTNKLFPAEGLCLSNCQSSLSSLSTSLICRNPHLRFFSSGRLRWRLVCLRACKIIGTVGQQSEQTPVYGFSVKKVVIYS